MNNYDLTKMLPPLLSGDTLIERLQDIPEYDENIRKEDTATRLMQSADIYKIYYPSVMSVEIYNKLYLATAMSLRKKGTKLAVMQKNANFKAMKNHAEYRGIIGGSDSFTIVGTSGIGKSSAIQRAVELIMSNGVLEYADSKIIPCIQVQCPFDASPKGMLLSVLKAVDDVIETEYYKKSLRPGVTTDILIGTVSQVCINHVGLLIIDEIQHVYGHKNGVTLVSMITQLINTSGISICMVGTEESIAFFEKAPQLARRALGLKYGVMPYDDYFKDFCRLVFSYQYTKKKTELTELLIQWLYEHSGGVISVVVAIVHEANELAIFQGEEHISLEILTEAYDKRITMLHSFIASDSGTDKRVCRQHKKEIPVSDVADVQEYTTIPDIIKNAKNKSVDIIEYLKDYIHVEEVVAE